MPSLLCRTPTPVPVDDLGTGLQRLVPCAPGYWQASGLPLRLSLFQLICKSGRLLSVRKSDRETGEGKSIQLLRIDLQTNSGVDIRPEVDPAVHGGRWGDSDLMAWRQLTPPPQPTTPSSWCCQGGSEVSCFHLSALVSRCRELITIRRSRLRKMLRSFREDSALTWHLFFLVIVRPQLFCDQVNYPPGYSVDRLPFAPL